MPEARRGRRPRDDAARARAVPPRRPPERGHAAGDDAAAAGGRALGHQPRGGDGLRTQGGRDAGARAGGLHVLRAAGRRPGRPGARDALLHHRSRSWADALRRARDPARGRSRHGQAPVLRADGYSSVRWTTRACTRASGRWRRSSRTARSPRRTAGHASCSASSTRCMRSSSGCRRAPVRRPTASRRAGRTRTMSSVPARARRAARARHDPLRPRPHRRAAVLGPEHDDAAARRHRPRRPRGNAADRRATSGSPTPSWSRLLDVLEPWAAGEDPDADDVRLISELRRDVEKAMRVPTSLAADMSRAAALGQAAWEAARAAADYGRFRDAMARHLELRRRYVECFTGYEHPVRRPARRLRARDDDREAEARSSRRCARRSCRWSRPPPGRSCSRSAARSTWSPSGAR